MKLDEFIANVLQNIDTGLKEAREKTDRKYFVRSGDYGNVTFDIAVTTVRSTGGQIEGSAKAGYIEVLGAKLGTKSETKDENSQVSRIQFNIFFPDRTEEEIKHEKSEQKTKQ